MIAITRLDGSTLVVNADLIETVEHRGDTVVTLVSGTRFVVRDSVAEIIDAVVRFRSGVLHAVESRLQGTGPDPVVSAPVGGGAAKVIPMSAKARSGDND